jgi:predicted dehydrogenase
MVGHTFQYNPAVGAIRDLVAAGELGRIYYINTTRANLGLLQSDINVVWDLAPHDVSILLHVLEAKPTHVHTHGEVYIQTQRQIHEVAYMTLHFDNGVMANLRFSWLDPVKTRMVTIVGSEKMLVYDDIADTKVTVYDKGVDVPPYSNTVEEFTMSYRHGPERAVALDWTEPLSLQCGAFVRWIRHGERAASDAAFGVRVVTVLEAAQRSLLSGGQREEIAL